MPMGVWTLLSKTGVDHIGPETGGGSSLGKWGLGPEDGRRTTGVDFTLSAKFSYFFFRFFYRSSLALHRRSST